MAFSVLLLTFALTLFLSRRLLTYLHYFQQEEYDAKRFLLWWAKARALDTRASVGILAAIIALSLVPYSALVIAALALWLGARAWFEVDPLTAAKKPLVFTPRASQIYYLAAALLVLPLFLVTDARMVMAAMALIQLPPFALILANALLTPLRIIINRRYLADARSILHRLHPTTIGITGSYGKTGTKYVLHHILASFKPTLMTPGSVNTPLGISRIVREQLAPQHGFFIAEMGAYGIGSIAKLCELVSPRFGIITAVGHAHYERFRSLADVARAKFELASSVVAENGHMVICVDSIPTELWQKYVSQQRKSFTLVSTDSHELSTGDAHLTNIVQSAAGLAFTLRQDDQVLKVSTPLFGIHNVNNLAAAAVMALRLGVPAKTIVAALKTVPAAPHRLNVRHDGKLTTIDDSYNSNPTGFASALEVLSLIAGNKRRRVLVTPGMVELGAAHDAEHARLGTLAAQHADVILALNPQRIPTFIAAASATQVVTLPNLDAARTWLQNNGKPDDVILIENDLPDLYEAHWSL